MNQQQLAAAERLLLADELLSHLRHAVSNKLGSARNAAFFIRRSLEKSGVPTDPRVPPFFKLIDDELGAAGEQLASRLGGDRDRSRPPGPTSLKECIDNALALRAPPTGVSVSVQCNDDVAVCLHAGQLIVALCYLIDNACESLAQAGQLAIVTAASADYLTLSVVDSGGGFSPESAKHAFDAFYTTKPGQLGLGLTLVHRILKNYGGKVVIEPVASGARVSVRLPRARSAPDPQLARGEPR